jgi:hypothetical protein
MKHSIDLIRTDYGNVELTRKTLSYLESIHPEWMTSRAKRAKAARNDIERAASVLAAIEWYAGGVLTKL